ncbi:MAG: tetratricopeptide repeat protein [bacterium]|nr:tetratricopeptide repeat protein [bacterium]
MIRSRKPEATLALILIFSTLIRVWFFRQLAQTNLVQIPLLDSLAYHEWAVRLVSGDPGWGEAYWMGPLYPHFLALVYAASGVGGMAISAVQLFLSVVNIALVFFISRDLFNGRKSSWAPVLSAGLYALYGAPVFYAGMILMATLVTTCYLLITKLALQAWRNNTTRSWVVLGLMTGVTGLARGNVFLLLLVLPFLIWKANPQNSALRWKRIVLLVASGLLLTIPTTLRNYFVANDFVVLTSNGGINLLIGQQVEYEGIFSPVIPNGQTEYDASMEKTLELEMGRDLKGSEVSSILTQRAGTMFRENLSAMPRHYFLKTYRFWNGYELPQIFSYTYWQREFLPLRILVLPFFVLTTLGLLGIYFLPKGPRLVFILLQAGYFLSLLPFFPTSRYRMPIAPLLAISAGLFLVYLWQMKLKQKGVWTVSAFLLAFILLPRWAELDANEVNWQVHLHQASRASKAENLQGTLLSGRLAEEAKPNLAETPYQLALYLERMKAWPQAEAALNLAGTRATGNRDIPYRRGIIQDQQNKFPEALSSFRQAANLDPDWALPWWRAGITLRKAGQMEDAVDAMEKARQRSPGHHRVRSDLASGYASLGQYPKALELLNQLVIDYPNYVNGWFNLALVNWRAGNEKSARGAINNAEQLRNLSKEQQKQIQTLKTNMAKK